MIAVLDERPDIAVAALGKIKAEWENAPAGPDDKTIFDHIQKTAPQPRVVGQSGDLAEGERLAASVIEETYLNSYVAHAPIETHSATAQIEDGKVTVWASSQAPFQVQRAVAAALGVPAEKVRIISGTSAAGSAAKRKRTREWRRRAWRRSRANRCRWSTAARKNFSTTGSGRPR